MHDWSDPILSDLEAFLARPDGSPAKLLQIFSEIISQTGPMYAETPNELSALHRTAQLLMDMFPGGSDVICERLREMRQVLAMWDMARDEGIPVGSTPLSSEERNELIALREENALLIRERNRLEDALQKAEDDLHRAFFQHASTAAQDAAPPDDADPVPPPDEVPAAPVPGKTHEAVEEAPENPFSSIAAHRLTRVNLNANANISPDAEHILVTKAFRQKKNRIIKCLTFYGILRLKTVEFDCEVNIIESGAFYHHGPLALKFRDPVCAIEPGAFSDDTRVALICAPFSNDPNSLRTYAQNHRIPFIAI